MKVNRVETKMTVMTVMTVRREGPKVRPAARTMLITNSAEMRRWRSSKVYLTVKWIGAGCPKTMTSKTAMLRWAMAIVLPRRRPRRRPRRKAKEKLSR